MTERLDVALFRRGLCASREAGRKAILEGRVSVAGLTSVRPSTLVDGDTSIAVSPQAEAYVSRAGNKLAHALRAFHISPQSRVCLDVGTSTGGFAQCLLAQGAEHVYGVDVGQGQLAPELHGHPRLSLREKLNIRHATSLDVYGTETPLANLGAVDVSFISLTLVLPTIQALLLPPFELVTLFKPQFEVGKGGLGKNGVVKDTAAVLHSFQKLMEMGPTLGIKLAGLEPSPLRGGDGNREYLAYWCELSSERRAVDTSEVAEFFV